MTICRHPEGKLAFWCNWKVACKCWITSPDCYCSPLQGWSKTPVSLISWDWWLHSFSVWKLQSRHQVSKDVAILLKKTQMVPVHSPLGLKCDPPWKKPGWAHSLKWSVFRVLSLCQIWCFYHKSHNSRINLPDYSHFIINELIAENSPVSSHSPVIPVALVMLSVMLSALRV